MSAQRGFRRGAKQLASKDRPVIRPHLRGWEPPGVVRRHNKALPRSPLAIGIAAVMFVMFLVPLGVVGSGLDWQVDGDLFSGVILVFQLAWMLGWSVGVVILGIACVALASGHEGFLLTRDHLYVRFEFLLLAIVIKMPLGKIGNIRPASGTDDDGTGWRGDYLGFDYAGTPIGYGTYLSSSEIESLAEPLRNAIAASAERATEDSTGAPGETPNDDMRSLPGISTATVAPGLGSVSTVALLTANLLPLAGVLFFAWSVGDIMLLYWAESAIIGFFNVAKMAFIGRWAVVFMGVFFLGHYGGFMAGHLLFIYAMFLSDQTGSAELASVAAVVADLVRLWPALIALGLSHGISFATNFLGRQEYRTRTMAQQMHAPYKRIIVMHVTIIFGGGIALMTASAVPALLLMIVLKVVVDVRAHLKEHAIQVP